MAGRRAPFTQARLPLSATEVEDKKELMGQEQRFLSGLQLNRPLLP